MVRLIEMTMEEHTPELLKPEVGAGYEIVESDFRFFHNGRRAPFIVIWSSFDDDRKDSDRWFVCGEWPLLKKLADVLQDFTDIEVPQLGMFFPKRETPKYK